MHIFDQFFAAFIGILIAALPAPGPHVATSTQTVVSSTTNPNVMSSADTVAFREALIRLQARFSSNKSDDSDSSPDDSDFSKSVAPRSSDDLGDADEDRYDRISSDARVRYDDDDEEDEEERGERGHDDEDEDDEDEDGDDDDRRRGTTASGTTQGSGSASQAPASQQVAATFTVAQVAAHATVTSCYSIVGGSVYDLTRWIAQHPGGSGSIQRMCGIDASAAFSGQHGGEARPTSELAGFKIGTLVR